MKIVRYPKTIEGAQPISGYVGLDHVVINLMPGESREFADDEAAIRFSKTFQFLKMYDKETVEKVAKEIEKESKKDTSEKETDLLKLSWGDLIKEGKKANVYFKGITKDELLKALGV